MLFMDKKNKVYNVTSVDPEDQATYDLAFDEFHDMENNYMIVLDRFGIQDREQLSDIVETLPLMKQFQLYELINNDNNSWLSTISDCLLDYADENSIHEVDTDTKQCFNDDFYFNYLDEDIKDLSYLSYNFDMFDLMDFLNNNLDNFNYCHVYGYVQGDEALVFNNEGNSYNDTEYVTNVLYGGLVMVDVLNEAGEVDYTEDFISDNYSPDFEKDNLIKYMKKYYNASLVKEKELI